MAKAFTKNVNSWKVWKLDLFWHKIRKKCDFSWESVFFDGDNCRRCQTNSNSYKKREIVLITHREGERNECNLDRKSWERTYEKKSAWKSRENAVSMWSCQFVQRSLFSTVAVAAAAARTSLVHTFMNRSQSMKTRFFAVSSFIPFRLFVVCTRLLFAFSESGTIIAFRAEEWIIFIWQCDRPTDWNRWTKPANESTT